MSNPVSLIAGNAIGQAVTGKNAASAAKRAAATATSLQDAKLQEAKDIATEQYGVSKGYIQPFYDQGVKGNVALNYGLGFGTDNGGNANVQSGSLIRPFSMADYQEDPGYQFRLSEGQKALDRNASAKRGYFSGAAQKGLMRFNQDQASNEFNNAYNRYNQNQQNAYSRLSDLASGGYAAGGSLANLSTGYGQDIGNLNIGQGANSASGVMAKNAANQSFYNTLGNIGGQISQGFGQYNAFGSGTNYNPSNIMLGKADNTLPWRV